MLDDVPVSLNYSIADIRDPEKRDTTFSKTITLPGTKNNNKLFSHIFKIGSSGGFNPNIKTKAVLYEDTIPVFSGYLQLINITVTDQNEIEYEVVIFGKLANIYTVIADDELTDISYSDLSHIYSKANIITTWTAPVGVGYVYPMIDYGATNGSYYNVENFLPALYLKEYIDRIFRYAGFSYTSNFFNGNFFKRLVVPYNGTKLQLTAQQLADRTFKIKQTPDLEYSQGDTVNFDSFVTTPNPSAQVDLSTDIWTVSETGLYAIYFNGQIFARVNNTGGSVNISPGGTGHIDVSPLIYISKAGGAFTYLAGFNNSIPLSTGGGTTFPTGSTIINGIVATSAITLNLVAGDRIKIRFFTSTFTAGTTPAGITFFAGLKAGSVFYNLPISDIKENGLLNYASAIPNRIKIRDFLTSIIKAFNLYIEEDKTNSNNLLIEPREDFYTNGTTYDWTNKLDISKPLEIHPMGLLDARDYYFTYKEDGDYWNDLYKRSFSKIYGDRLISSGNDFLTEKKTNELIFSPTPLVNIPVGASSTRVIPQIVTADTNGNISPKSSNIRLLYWGGMKNCNQTWTFKSISGGTTYTTYPYAGHLDDPFDPSLDLSFGVPQEIFYVPNIYTNNNLYNVYWKKFIQEITDKDSKLVTGYFHLKPIDMLRLDFRNKIFVDGFYYFLNKITDYNPVSDELTKVELIKIKDGISFLPTTGSVNTATLVLSPASATSQDGGDTGAALFNIQKKDGNQYNTQSGQTVNGIGNIIDASAINIIVSGDGNVIGSGANNVSLINSSGNTISQGLLNVTLINTSGATVSRSNVALLKGNPILSGSGTVNYYSKFSDTDVITSALLTEDANNIIVPSGKYISSQDTSKIRIDLGTTGAENFFVTTDGGGNDSSSLVVDPSIAAFSAGLVSGGTWSTVTCNSTSSQMAWHAPVNFKTFRLTETQAAISGGGAFKGIEYASDYSANYSNRSLIDKAYALANFSLSSGVTSYTAGTGLGLSGTQFRLNIPVIATQGGTGQTVYAVGDILSSSGTTSDSLKKIPAVGTGYIFASSGVSALPGWASNPFIATSVTTPLDIGGVNTTSTKTFRTTSGVGTIGADFIWQSGNNGATELMRLLNNGTLGIGTTTPGTVNGAAFSSLKFQLQSTGTTFFSVNTSGRCGFLLNDSSQSANSRLWSFNINSNIFSMATLTDAGSSTDRWTLSASGASLCALVGAGTGTGSVNSISFSSIQIHAKSAASSTIVADGASGSVFLLNVSSNPADSRLWSMNINGTSLALSTLTDAGVGTDQVTISRTGVLSVLLGDFKITTAGKTIYLKEGGAAATSGQGQLVGGTLLINTTSVAANSRIHVTDAGGGVIANIGALYIAAIIAGVSFTVTSNNPLDTSFFNWFIIQPA